MSKAKHVVTCEDCGKQREVRIDKNPPRCMSCAQKKAQRGKKLGPKHSNKKCLNAQCDNYIRANNAIGYCYHCFHANIDGIKTADSKRRGSTIEGRIKGYAQRGGKITEEDLVAHDAATHCGFCEREFTGNNKCLDHCHNTGQYRGSLCRRCNGALGNLGDDLNLIIKRAKKYNEARRVQPSFV